MSSGNKMLIYLADDDLDDCFLFEEALKIIPIETSLAIAHNGAELMEMLGKTEDLPQILFLDLNMPLKNGDQCLQEIKKNERLKDIEVVILTTFITGSIADRLLKFGAKRCVEKPNDLRLLTKSLAEMLSADMKNTSQN